MNKTADCHCESQVPAKNLPVDDALFVKELEGTDDFCRVEAGPLGVKPGRDLSRLSGNKRPTDEEGWTSGQEETRRGWQVEEQDTARGQINKDSRRIQGGMLEDREILACLAAECGT